MKAVKKCQGAGILAVILFLYLWYGAGVEGQFQALADSLSMNNNFFIYFSSIFLSGALVFLFHIVSRSVRYGEKKQKFWGVIYRGACFGTAGFLIYWFIQSYFCEDTSAGLPWGNYIRHNMSHEVWILWVFLCAALFWLGLAGEKKAEEGRDRRRMVAAVIAGTVYYALLYAPAFLGDRLGTVQHSHAYVNSIINVMYGTPYSDVALGIYGFYGILYYPFVKLFGDNYYAIVMSIAMFGFILCFLACWTASKLIRYNGVYYLCVLGIVGTVSSIYAGGQYYQALPHRLFFPIVILSYIVGRYKKRGKSDSVSVKNGVADILLLMLAVTWNLETGLCCCAVLSFYYIVLGILKLKETGGVEKRQWVFC